MAPKEFDIEGRTVIVTGAARGIGKGIVSVLAEAGARVLATALTDRYLGPLASEMAVRGHPIETLVADATKAADMDRTVQRGLELWGRIDVFINNVGDSVTKPVVPLPGSQGGLPITDEEWRYVLDVNLTQAFLGCRAVGPHMLSRRRGKVINISSFASAKVFVGQTGYAAAKAGLAQFTRALALEWAPFGVTVNAIAPGFFPDPETSTPEQMERARERARSLAPLGRSGETREVGLLALYMASDASNYLTGAVVYLDGGMTLT
ncbi:MAG: SDR family oxidoreductase [Chloroflexi bacterium]|nr:SDR family oxidoreductase [Chloroflexota bacterium]